MYQTINYSQFNDAFTSSIRPDTFSYKGLHALFDWLESYEEDTGEEQELDVIAICCDFTEYASIEEYNEIYGGDAETVEDIEEKTIVIPVYGGGFIIQNY